MSWKVDGRQVSSTNGNTIQFDYSVKETREVGDILIVLLDVPADHVMTENVFGVSAGGELLWQIEAIAGNSTSQINCYTGITGCDGRTAQIYNWNGTSNTVDVRTGKVLRTSVVK